MQEASETKNRLYVEDGKVKCGLSGRSRGKRCGSTLMINGTTVCAAGHKFSLDELVTATLEGTPNSHIARAMLAITSKDWELAEKLIFESLEEKFSPPYSLPKSRWTKSDEERRYYRWMDDNLWGFTILLHFATWWHPNYAEALRQVWIERSLQGESITQALLKLHREAQNGNFRSQMLRDHLMDCAVRSMYSNTLTKKAMRYYLLIEALKINGDTNLIWLYEDSLEELSRLRRCNHYHPIIFEYDEREAGRMTFYLYFRLPEGNAQVIEGQLQIRIYDFGRIEFRSYASTYISAPGHEALDQAVTQRLKELNGEDGGVLCVKNDTMRPKSPILIEEPQWQLKALDDLRTWFGNLKVNANQ